MGDERARVPLQRAGLGTETPSVQSDGVPAEEMAQLGQLVDLPTVIARPRPAGRGFEATRADLLLRAQRTVGNHHVQRLIQGEAGSAATTADLRQATEDAAIADPVDSSESGAEHAGSRAVRDLPESPGRPLPGEVRGPLESSFGRDFSEVRLHNGPAVDASAEGIDAAAFTVGSDVYLHSAVPGPQHDLGRLVLAEEMAHVAQGVGTAGAHRILDASSAVETQAHQAALAAVRGDRATVSSAPDPAALGRFLLPALVGGGLIYAAGKALLSGDEESVEAEKAPLGPADKAKLVAQLPILEGARGQVDTGKPSTIRDSFSGVKEMVASIPAAGPTKETLRAASNAINNAHNVLSVLVDSEGTKLGMRTALVESVGAIREIAALAQEPPTAEPGQPAPERTALTPSEAAQLNGGAVAGIQFAIDQIGEDKPAYDLVIARLASVRDTLAGFGAPPAIQEKLSLQGRRMDAALQTVLALSGDEKQARELAKSHLSSAISAIQFLSGAPATAAPPPSGESSGGTPPVVPASGGA